LLFWFVYLCLWLIKLSPLLILKAISRHIR
jgi:hypothetical protein